MHTCRYYTFKVYKHMVKYKLTLEIDNNKQFSKKLIVVNIDTSTK